MAVLRIQEFSGIVPVTGDRAIPDNFATKSLNTWLYGSELRGIRPPEHLIDLLATTRKAMRIPKRTPGVMGAGYPAGYIPPPSFLGDSVWVQFNDPDTDIVRGQLVKDSFERWYFCSPSTGPVFNTYARLSTGLGPYKLGVPGPDTTVDAAGNNAWKPTITNIAAMEIGGEIFEIEFKIGTTAGSTAYANAGGTGDRQAAIVETGTATVTPSVSSLINGNLTETGVKFTNLQTVPKYLRWDFGVTKFIDEFTWYQKDSIPYGAWMWRGSPDASTWTDLKDLQLGGTAKQAYTVPGTTGYRYFELLQDEVPDTFFVTRAYVYTWINKFGEESPPSLPVLGSGNTFGIWTIGNILDPPASGGTDPRADGYAAYEKKRLYRTITGASGQTTYYMVAEHVIGATVPDGGWVNQTTYNDNGTINTDAIIAQNLRLESTKWALPPSNLADPKDCLQGFIGMANGFLIGFTVGNRVLMSEPYHFHAWPAEYEQATEYPVVGLGVIGQTCVVATQGFPATATGTHPSVISFTKSTVMEPCLSRGSVVSAPSGVVYASPNGLILVGAGGLQNITQSIITREEWMRDYYPSLIRSARYQNGYLALIDRPTPIPNNAFLLDPTALKVALTEISQHEATLDFNATNFFNDVWSGNVFLIDSAGKLFQWDPVFHDPDTANPTVNNDLMPVVWRSKEFQYPFEENFSCYAIYWDEARYSNVNWGTIMATTERVRFRVYCNRVLRYDQPVPRNGRPVRLPSGFKGDVWQFEILARAPVYVMHVASTVKELKAA